MIFSTSVTTGLLPTQRGPVRTTTLDHAHLRATRRAHRRAVNAQMNSSGTEAIGSVPPSWVELSAALPTSSITPPAVIDSTRQRERPEFSTERPTLFRERHGWSRLHGLILSAPHINGWSEAAPLSIYWLAALLH